MSKKKEDTNVTNLPAKQEGGVVVAAPPNPEVAGIVAGDVVIPRLLLMQGQSEFIIERKKSPAGDLIQQGDIVRSTTLDVLATPEKPLRFIPLTAPVSTWVRLTKPPGAERWAFRGMEARNAKNDHLDWSFFADKDGRELPQNAPGAQEWKRVKCLSAYFLLPADIDAHAAERAKVEKGEEPDLSKALTPVLAVFRSTSFKAGKELVTHFTQAAGFRQKASDYSLELSCFLDKNDQGSFYVFSVDRNQRKATPTEYRASAEEWKNIIMTQPLAVDSTGEDLGDEAPMPTSDIA